MGPQAHLHQPDLKIASRYVHFSARQSRLDRVNAEGPCLPKVNLADPNTPDQRDLVQRNCFEFALYTPRDHDCISNRIGSGIRNCPRCRCRLATFGALPTSSMIDRAIIMLNDHRFWGHAAGPSSSSGKTLSSFHPLLARPCRSALPRERFSPLAPNGLQWSRATSGILALLSAVARDRN